MGSDERYWDPEETGIQPELNELANRIIGAAIAVHRELRPGYPEVIYQRALAIELAARSVPCTRERPFELKYRGQVIGAGQLDFLVDTRVIVELKSIDQIGPVQQAQVLAYQRANKIKIGILINFNVKVLKDGIRRYAI